MPKNDYCIEFDGGRGGSRVFCLSCKFDLNRPQTPVLLQVIRARGRGGGERDIEAPCDALPFAWPLLHRVRFQQPPFLHQILNVAPIIINQGPNPDIKPKDAIF